MVLVVDDEDRMVRFIRLNLEHDGFQVIEAEKGMKAVNLDPGKASGYCPAGCDATGYRWV